MSTHPCSTQGMDANYANSIHKGTRRHPHPSSLGHTGNPKHSIDLASF